MKHFLLLLVFKSLKMYIFPRHGRTLLCNNAQVSGEVFISYLEEKNVIAVLKNRQNTVYFLAAEVKSELPAAALELKEDKERKKKGE